jgi:hypothetical protein
MVKKKFMRNSKKKKSINLNRIYLKQTWLAEYSKNW